MTQNSSQNPIPYSPEPETVFAENANRVYSLKGANTKDLYRRYKYLLTDLIATGREVQTDELIELTYLKDRLFNEANVHWIHSRCDDLRNLSSLQDILISGPRFGLSPSELCKGQIKLRRMNINVGCSYFGQKYNVPPKSLLVVRSPYRKRTRAPRAKKFIGVGYRDQGNMKNLAIDGSPSWKEVSSYELPNVKRFSFYGAVTCMEKFADFPNHPVFKRNNRL